MALRWPLISSVRRLTLALAAVGGLAGLFACSRGPADVCANDAVQEKVYAIARDRFPNKVSQELLGHASGGVLERLLKEHNLDRNKIEDLQKAAGLGVVESKKVYQGGRYVLEDVAAVPKDQSGPTIHCGGRMVFYTSWGIVVRNVAYDVKPEGDSFDVTLAEF